MPSRRQTAAVAWTAGDDRLRLLLDGMADHAVVMLGPHGMVLTWNAGACRILGYLAEEIIGQHFSTFYCDDSLHAGAPQSNLDEALRCGRYEEEGWRVRKDGTRFWASVVLTPLRDRSGRLRGFGQVMRDLSDRLRAQDLLAVLDAASDAILAVDEDGRIIFANAAAARLFAYDPAELVGHPVEVLVPASSRALHARWRADFTAAGASSPHPRTGVSTGVTAVRGDGATFAAEVTLARVDTPRGCVVTATVRDRTRELATQRAIPLFGQRLGAPSEVSAGEGGTADHAHLVDALATALAATTEQVIIATDVRARIAFVNRGAELLLGYGAEELLGRPAETVSDPRELASLAAELGMAPGADPIPELLRLGRGAVPRRWTYVGKGGERRPVWLTISVVGDERDPLGYLGVATDVTDAPDVTAALDDAADARESAPLIAPPRRGGSRSGASGVSPPAASAP